MTTLPVVPQDVPVHDNTMFSDLVRCPRLYYYRHLRGLRKNGVHPALQFGALLHHGLDVWYTTRNGKDVLDAMTSYPDFIEPEDDYRTRARAILTITEYMTMFPTDPFEVLHTELPYTLEEPDGFKYGGVIDLIVRWNGMVWILDHKSASRGGETFWAQFYLSPQMTGYTWAGTLLHGSKITGALVNQLLIHRVKKSPIEQFARRSFPYDDAHIAEWKQSVIDLYHEAHRRQILDRAGVQLDQAYPVNWHNCINKYGKCPFFNVCKAPESSREALIEQDFTVDFWTWERD